MERFRSGISYKAPVKGFPSLGNRHHCYVLIQILNRKQATFQSQRSKGTWLLEYRSFWPTVTSCVTFSLVQTGLVHRAVNHSKGEFSRLERIFGKDTVVNTPWKVVRLILQQQTRVGKLVLPGAWNQVSSCDLWQFVQPWSSSAKLSVPIFF